MQTGQAGKTYGLILKPKSAVAIARASVFAEDDDSFTSQMKQQQRRLAETASSTDATAIDSSLLDYDGWKESEDTRAQVQQRRVAAAPVRSSKYIGTLMAKAEERKADRDIVYERKLAREREAEEEEFGPTESFVTSAYKAKLEERKARESELAQKAAVDAINDVTKKSDMTGFYRGLLMNNNRFGAHAGASLGAEAEAPRPAVTMPPATRAPEMAQPPPRAVPASVSATDMQEERRVSFAVEEETEAINNHSATPALTPASPAKPKLLPWAHRTSPEELDRIRAAALARFEEKYGFIPSQ
jgi:hypothetical protein